MPKKISEQDWGDLLTSIELGECILIIGPHIAMPGADDEQRAPLVRQLARQLAQLLPADKISDASNLSHVTEAYIRETNNLTRFKGQLQAFYSRDHQPPPALEQLAHLPFRLIVNTAPDDTLRKAFLKRHLDFKWGYYNFDHSGTQEDPNYDAQNSVPFIYHLFGDASVPGSVVITESQQVEFVQQIIQKEHKIPNSIQAVFRESKNYLFVGFDFSDWYIRLLLSALNPKEEVKIPLSFAFHSGARPLSATEESFFGKRFKLNFFDADAESFTAELSRRWEQKSAPAAPVAAAPKGGAPTALLLFADEDADWRDKALMHAKTLPKERQLQFLEAAPGENIEEKRNEHMQTASVVICLVNAAFLNQHWDVWEQRLQVLHRENKTVVIPILIEETLWDSLPGIQSMPVLPRAKKAVSVWNQDEDEAWRHIMTEIDTILKNI